MTKKTSSMGALLDENGPAIKANLPDEGDIKIPDTPIVKQPEPETKQLVPDRRGKKARDYSKLYTSIGISRRFLPPITRKRSAVYELVVQKGTKDRRLEGPDQYVEPQPYQLVPSYTFLDFEESDLGQREKTLTYYEGGTEVVYIPDPITKKNIAQSIPKIGSPEFIMGQKVVNIEMEYAKYVWWELHPRNGSNKWRDKSKDPIFKRADIEYKSPHVLSIQMDLQKDAEEYVIKLSPDKRMNLAAALTNPTVNPNVNPQELFLTLRMRARENPEEILFTRGDKTNGSIKIATIHALDLGILTYIPENDCYYIADDNDAAYHVPIGNNPFESICKFFDTEEGEEHYNRVKDMLSFWF